MLRSRLSQRLILLCGAVFLLSACSETRLAIHAIKMGQRTFTQDDIDKGKKSGTQKPYKVNGVWYYPKDDPYYDESGLASWYGPKYHGRSTANGEIYDQYAMTAAHKTLPIPSFVRVTNLENGRSVELRINDRGPFVANRIIDVSRAAADRLEFRSKGVARVRVENITQEYIARNNPKAENGRPEPAARYKAPPLKAVKVVPVEAEESLEPLASAEPGLPVGAVPIRPSAVSPALPEPQEQGTLGGQKIYIQVGAFGDFNRATRHEGRLQRFGKTSVTRVDAGGRILYRLRVGPYGDPRQAGASLQQVQELGFPDAMLMVER